MYSYKSESDWQFFAKQKVAKYMHQSATLLQEGTDDSAGLALGSIEEALSISRYSERLLQMKGEALYIVCTN